MKHRCASSRAAPRGAFAAAGLLFAIAMAPFAAPSAAYAQSTGVESEPAQPSPVAAGLSAADVDQLEREWTTQWSDQVGAPLPAELQEKIDRLRADLTSLTMTEQIDAFSEINHLAADRLKTDILANVDAIVREATGGAVAGAPMGGAAATGDQPDNAIRSVRAVGPSAELLASCEVMLEDAKAKGGGSLVFADEAYERTARSCLGDRNTALQAGAPEWVAFHDSFCASLLRTTAGAGVFANNFDEISRAYCG